jgi:hypothetical protein
VFLSYALGFFLAALFDKCLVAVYFLSTCCLRAANQGVLSFKSGYSLQDEILKTLE